MPRRSGGGGGGGGRAPARAPTRPTAAPQRQPNPPPQARSASTAAGPPAQQAPPAQGQSRGPGLFGQMASTAAGVAVGSSIGHAVGGWFSGGSSSEPAAAQQDNYSAQAANPGDAYGASSSYAAPKACEGQIGQFKTCMDQNEGSLTICGWYLDQLKACQSAASQY